MGKPIAQVARDLGINDGTLANWVAQDRRARGRPPQAGSVRTNAPSWSGCVRRTPSWRWSVTCSSDLWSCGSRRRRSECGRVRRRPEDRARRAARGDLPGVGAV
ncbi:transposase [Micromonospora sp. NPDC047548]|uniref:transposase n=1 Tax=Micromonospora sp. NPDC047548 TaxID=3155624 RepID=UPI0033EFAA7B